MPRLFYCPLTAPCHDFSTASAQQAVLSIRLYVFYPFPPVQVRKFQPEMVAIRDPSKIPELKEAIKDLPQQPVILGGDEGAVEVARHPSAEVGPARHGCVLP